MTNYLSIYHIVEHLWMPFARLHATPPTAPNAYHNTNTHHHTTPAPLNPQFANNVWFAQFSSSKAPLNAIWWAAGPWRRYSYRLCVEKNSVFDDSTILGNLVGAAVRWVWRGLSCLSRVGLTGSDTHPLAYVNVV